MPRSRALLGNRLASALHVADGVREFVDVRLVGGEGLAQDAADPLDDANQAFGGLAASDRMHESIYVLLPLVRCDQFVDASVGKNQGAMLCLADEDQNAAARLRFGDTGLQKGTEGAFLHR